MRVLWCVLARALSGTLAGALSGTFAGALSGVLTGALSCAFMEAKSCAHRGGKRGSWFMAINWAKAISCAEKGHYPFKRYPQGPCETVLFPGCAFMSQFPQTTSALVALCAQQGVGVAYDCCGLSLEGFGKAEGAARVLAGIEARLAACGCKRLVAVCPNCYYYFKGKLLVPVLTVYDLLVQWGFKQQGAFESGFLYASCPDKATFHMEQQIRQLFQLDQVQTYAQGCCGLKPELAARGAQVSQKAGQAVLRAAGGQLIYTYCASCAGQFARLGATQVQHVLSVALGIIEPSDTAHAFLNRAKRKFG